MNNIHSIVTLAAAILCVIFLVYWLNSDRDEFWTLSTSRITLSATSNKQITSNITGLEAAEVGLANARNSIRRAAFKRDPTCIPQQNCIYFHKTTFLRSYKQMEKRMKIYVYKEGDLPLVHDAPTTGLYSTEGMFINQLEQSSFLTKDPEEANVYFLPFSVTMMVKLGFKPAPPTMPGVRRFVGDYVDVISRKYPFWNRSRGADHFMLSCHDWAPYASKSHEWLFKRSIRVLCNANTSEGFEPAKDASLPEMKLLRNESSRTFGGLAAEKRDILAFFAGGRHGPVRPILFQHWLNSNGSSSTDDPDMQIHEYLPKQSQSYSELMGRSRFCLCPSGYEVASPRLVESIYSGCVPVVLSWSYVLPFSDVLDWRMFSLNVLPSEIPRLKQILQAVSHQRYLQLFNAVARVRPHFRAWQPTARRFDMFHMILHSVWLRRLNAKIISAAANSSSASPVFSGNLG